VPQGSAASRVVAPILVTAITASGVAVALNLATAWKNNLWAWLTVGVLTLISGMVAVWLYRKQTAAADELSRRTRVGNEAEIGRKSRIGRALLEAKQWNRLRTGSRAQIRNLTMRAGTTNDSRRTATRATSAADMRSDNGPSKPSSS
jgi:hypothetical protein